MSGAWRGHVYPNPARFELIVQLFRPSSANSVDVVIGVDGKIGALCQTVDTDSPAALSGQPTDNCLRIPEDMGRALLDVLAQHYGGTGDTRQLRKDYDAERARVDRLITGLLAPNP